MGKPDVSRRPDGTIMKGSVLNPNGRRNERTELNEIIDQEVSEDDWRLIFQKAKTQAIAGDRYAREWLTDNRYGKPTQRFAITNEDDQVVDWSVGEVKVITPDADEDTQPNGEFMLPDTTEDRTTKDRPSIEIAENGDNRADT